MDNLDEQEKSCQLSEDVKDSYGNQRSKNERVRTRKNTLVVTCIM